MGEIYLCISKGHPISNFYPLFLVVIVSDGYICRSLVTLFLFRIEKDRVHVLALAA